MLLRGIGDGRLRVGGRLVRQRAGHALGGADATLGGIAGLLAAHGGLTRFLVGAVDLGRFLAAREVDVGGGLGVHVAGADQGIQDGEDALDGALLDLAHEAKLVGVHAAAFAQRGGQQAAVLVDDGHAFGGQFRHAGSHQPGDRGHLGIAQAAARVQVQQHGGGGRLALAHEQRLARHGQVDAGVLHGVHGFDRTGQLALQTALVVDLFRKLAGAEAGVVHQLEADGAAARQALRGQLQPGVIDAVGGHQQRGAVFVVTVGHVHRAQGRHDGAAVTVVQVREQNLVLRFAAPHDHGDDHRDKGRGGAEQDGLGKRADPFQHGELGQKRRAQGSLLIH